jgi:hypothetical protein
MPISAPRYDALRKAWKRLLSKVVLTAPREWRAPWFAERYGNGRVIRDTGTMATAVAADWSRGVSIEHVPGRSSAVAFFFALCWVRVPGGNEAPGARRLAIRSTFSPPSRRIVESLLRAWVVDEVSESELMSIGRQLGAVASTRDFKTYQRAAVKQLRSREAPKVRD